MPEKGRSARLRRRTRATLPRCTQSQEPAKDSTPQISPLLALPLELERGVLEYLDAFSLANLSMTENRRQKFEMVNLVNQIALEKVSRDFSEDLVNTMKAWVQDSENNRQHMRTLAAQPQLINIRNYASGKLGLTLNRLQTRLDDMGKTPLKWVMCWFSSSLIQFVEQVDNEHEEFGTDSSLLWGAEEYRSIQRASLLDNPIAHRERAIRMFTKLSTNSKKEVNAARYCHGIFWLQRAAPYDHLAKSLLASGLSFPDEFDVPELKEGLDVHLILALYQDAASFGLLDAQVNLGMIFTGKFMPFPENLRASFCDHEISYKWWSKAANCGQPEALINLGHMYAQGNAPDCHGLPNEQRAFKIWHRLMHAGDLRGNFLIALCYANGRGVRQNYDSAISILCDVKNRASGTRLGAEATSTLRTILASFAHHQNPNMVANPQGAE